MEAQIAPKETVVVVVKKPNEEIKIVTKG